MNWSKLKKGFKELGYLAWHNTVNRMEKMGADVYLLLDGKRDISSENEIMDDYAKIEVGYDLPEEVEEINFVEDATPEEMGATIASAQGGFLDEDLDDNWMDYAFEVGTRPPTSLPNLPENQQEMYLPAGGRTGKKPSMTAIRFWVINQKMQTMTDEDIIDEYYRYDQPDDYRNIKKGEGAGDIQNEQDMYAKGRRNYERIREAVIDGATYRVSRKNWYVGRKPRWMSNAQWDEYTKHLRPPEGSFGKNDTWGGVFPYDINYKYESGYD